jgi:hypothetical protein
VVSAPSASIRKLCDRWYRVSQTLFEGAGLGYEFVVNDKG